MSDKVEVDIEEAAEPLNDIAKHIPDAPVAPAHGIAAIALGLAVKYHDICTVQDGALYQQYKLEGRNLRAIGLNDVFETAIAMEKHLLASSDRIAKVVIDALEAGIEEAEERHEGEPEETEHE